MPSVCLVDTRMCFLPHGGPNYFLIALAGYLKERGWRVHVVGQDGPSQHISDAFGTRGMTVLADIWKPWHLPEEKADCLCAWVAQEKPDIFLVSNCTDIAWLALPRLPSEVRTVTVAHGDLPGYYDPVRHYFAFIDRAVGVSPQIAGKLAQMTGGPALRCPYIPYGVETLDRAGLVRKTSQVRAGPLRVGYVGRVVESLKRVFRLPSLVAELVRRQVPIEFDVIGDGPDRVELERLFHDEGVQDHVRFRGWLSGAELQKHYDELDVLVLVSDSEGLPIAILEAMGHGVAPVVSNIDSGITAVIQDGENGFLLPPADSQRFADRIEQLSKDAGQLHQMQTRSWETSQNYTVERMGAAYEAMFDELLAPSSKRSDRPLGDTFPPMTTCRSRFPLWVRMAKSRACYLYASLMRKSL